jgi:hypothetical protein
VKGSSRAAIEEFNRRQEIDAMLGDVGRSLGFVPFELHE